MATRHRDEWRSESTNNKSYCLAESQLCQAFAYGRPRIDRKDGRFYPPSSVPRAYRNEPAAVSETIAAPDRAPANVDGRSRCYKRCVRGRLRECEPIQPRVQSIFRPTAHSRQQGLERKQHRRGQCCLARVAPGTKPRSVLINFTSESSATRSSLRRSSPNRRLSLRYHRPLTSLLLFSSALRTRPVPSCFPLRAGA